MKFVQPFFSDSTYIGGVKVLLLLLIFFSASSVLKLVLPSFTLELFSLLVSFFLIFRQRQTIPSYIYRIFLFVLVIFLFSSLVTNSSIVNYIGIYLRFITAGLVIVVFNRNIKEFRFYLCQSLWILTYLSLANFILYTFFPTLFGAISVGDDYYLSIGYIFNYWTQRNQGIFTEPGILQMFINLLILIELVCNNKKIHKLVVPTFVVLTTASTTGYIIMGIAYLYVILFGNRYGKKYIKNSLLIIVAGFFVLPFMYANFKDKISGDSSVSAAYRKYDLVMGLQIITDHPIFGIGVDNDKYRSMTKNLVVAGYEDISISSNRGNSNGLMEIAVSFGLPLLFYSLYIISKPGIIEYDRKLFVIYYILSFNSEPLYFTAFNFIFIFWCLTNKRYNKTIIQKY